MCILKYIAITFLRAPKDLKTCYGSWALITGSTDGIGKAYAFELATQGLNLILVSRNPERLKQVSIEIQQKFPSIEIKVVAVDFSKGYDMFDGIGEIVRIMQGLEIGVLINNVGITYPKAMYFHEVDEEIWVKVVRVNLEATTRVTQAVLKAGMLRRKRGAIVNIGSGAAIVVPSHPLYTIYAATKAYVDQLSRSLHVEYKNLGIDVQCQVPLYVATKMTSSVASIERSSLFTPTAEEYAAAAVRRIGYEARCTPHWSHSFQWCLATFVPKPCLDAWRLYVGVQRRSAKCLT